MSAVGLAETMRRGDSGLVLKFRPFQGIPFVSLKYMQSSV